MLVYTVETAEAMEFPPGVNEPDKSKLCMLAAELLMAKLEAEQMSKEPGQSPASFRRGDTALMYTGASTGDYSMNSATSMRSGPVLTLRLLELQGLILSHLELEEGVMLNH